MVVLCCYAVAGAPEVPLERLQLSNAPIRDPVVCRYSPTYFYCLSTEVRVWFNELLEAPRIERFQILYRRSL